MLNRFTQFASQFIVRSSRLHSNSLRSSLSILAVWLMFGGVVQAGGTWTKLTNNNPSVYSGTMLLLTDGTVIVQAEGVSKVWTKLTPDSSGNYVNGTWSSIASMSLERLYTGSVILPSGKVFILGGEYSGSRGRANWINSGEIYDPATNQWTPTAPFPRSTFGDGQAVLLPNGKVLAGYLSNTETFLYDPNSNTWSQTGSKLRGDRNNEETWLLLPNGEVLCYEIFTNRDTGPWSAQRYVASTGQWVDAGNVPVQLSSSTLGSELGPAGLLPDGRAIQTGGNNNTAIYTPATNSWIAGPTLPAGLGADDSPGAMLPTGNFLFAVDSVTPDIFTPPTRLFEFDYSQSIETSLTEVTPGGTLGTELSNAAAYTARMLVLPNGHMLFTNGSGSIWDYAPTGAPQESWKPTISSVVRIGATSTYTLTGTKLTGISEGANYGDDAGLSTNFPIIRFTGPSGVKYGKSFSWTPGVSNVTDTTETTMQFTLPAGLINGNYQLATIANGIASNSFSATINGNVITNVSVVAGSDGGNVVATYNSSTKTLSLTGDTKPNSVSVTFNSGTGKLEVLGLNGTKINNVATTQTNPQTYTHTGKLTLKAVLSDGDDYFEATNINAALLNLNLGNGNDSVGQLSPPAGLKMCSIDKLQVDGGAGVRTTVYSILSRIPTIGTKRILKNAQIVVFP